MNPTVIVIGGANMDIGGSPSGDFRLHDSNPGVVHLRPGGVGRNIAHNLHLLGAQVSLITALGEDFFGEALRRSCSELGLDLSMSLTVRDLRTSTYLYLSEGSGELHAAIADMGVTARLTPDYLCRWLPRLERADAVVLDANLPQESIEFLCENCHVPLYADPVSSAKATRLKNVLPYLAAIKPNALEAELLTAEHDATMAARALMAKGVRRVFISMGSQGLLAAEGEDVLKLPALSCEVVNATGAGDAAMAAIVWSGICGADLAESAMAALTAGAQTAACASTVNPKLKLE